jgi:hypothetical protein
MRGLLLGATFAYDLPDLMLLDVAAQSGRGGAGKLTGQTPEQARFNLVMGYANVGLAGLDMGLEAGVVRGLQRIPALVKSASSLTQIQSRVLMESVMRLKGNVSDALIQKMAQVLKGADRLTAQTIVNADGTLTQSRPLGQVANRMETTAAAQASAKATAQQLQEKLVERGVQASSARKMLEQAKSRPEVMEALETLINGRGKGQLRNPQGLVELVEKATTKKNPIGFVRELQLAAERVKLGHEVGLGLGADIVDFSAKEAIQLKNVTSPKKSKVGENLGEAANQLTGERGEVVPKGADGKRFQRTAEIIIDNPKNPLYDKKPNQLLKELQEQFSANPTLQEHVDMVRIRAGDKVYEFGVSRSKSGDFKFINAPSPKKLSELPQSTSTEIASESQSEGTIQVATQLPQESQNQIEIG